MTTATQLPLTVRDLGSADYLTVWQAMQDFTQTRQPDTIDELWFVEHSPVFTLGMNADPAHVLRAGTIPLVKTDRGGQVTYHAPGQLVMYTLLDLNRLNMGVKKLVRELEQTIINYLARHAIAATGRVDAPGVYVDAAKIAALGLRIRRSKSYHGLSLNVDMDLNPFSQINPCGYQNLAVTQLCDLLAPGTCPSMQIIKSDLLEHFCSLLGYNPTSA